MSTYVHMETEMKTCTVEGCGKKHWGRGYCRTHHGRWYTHGDPTMVLRPRRASGADHHRWKGNDITSSGAHRRVYRARGKASEYNCTSCGSQAVDWAYDHLDPNEKSEVQDHGGRRSVLIPYSTDVNRYQPMCRKCHFAFDTERLT